jgi:L-lactate dehydrogenase complex protein LldG
MQREQMLHKIRTALGRSAGPPADLVPPVRIEIPQRALESRIAMFLKSFEALGGKGYLAASLEDARGYVSALLASRTAVAARHPLLEASGIANLPGVRAGSTDREELREQCAGAGLGITGVDFALADTGTLVMLAGPAQPRLISLLPPVHLAMFRASQLLSSLDELFHTLPRPAEQTSSMVLITGPSRTGDIEQILVRGVHGPGEIHAVIIA